MNVRKLNRAFDILLHKEKNVSKMTWIRTHKRGKTPAELRTCLGNNIYLLRFRKYDAEKHSFQRGSKRISSMQDKLETRGRRNTLMPPWGNQPLPRFFLLKYANQITQNMVWHLPMEISRITKFILQRGARVQATVLGRIIDVALLFKMNLMFFVLSPLQCPVAQWTTYW